MKFHTLPEWLAWQESLHYREIDLGLERVQQVLKRLQLSADFVCPLITVAGTNGKGSTLAMLESILLAAGYSTLCYTSPHLFVYNERIRLNGQNASDDALCDVFEYIDQARGDIPLSYFEFGTLAAIVMAAQQQVDVLVLEVGLGGRLDAVNVLNADVAIVTTVDIDHTDWLGDDIETIAREKAGIFRPHRPAFYGGLRPAQSLLDYADEIKADLKVAGRDYLYQAIGSRHWRLMGASLPFETLPLPAIPGACQMQNGALAVMALDALSAVSINTEQVAEGLQNVSLAGRFQQIHARPAVYVDVAHNAQAAAALAQLLADEPVSGRTLVVLAMLADKAVQKVIAALWEQVDEWFSAGLSVPRGLGADEMAKALNQAATNGTLCACKTVAEACEKALLSADEDDRIIVLGSFYTVAEASRFFHSSG